MKKILSIIILSLLLSTHSYSQILNLKCTFNSGFSVPPEDLSSKKGEIQFYKIDLKNKKILDSPSGSYKNNKTDLRTEYVRIDSDKIVFGFRNGGGIYTSDTEINRQTGQLEETSRFNAEKLKGMFKYIFLCVKTDSKNKF